MKNKLKKEYFSNLLSEDAKRSKQLWKTSKTLVPGGSTTSVNKLVTEDGEEVTCPKGMADHFNIFSENVGVTLASKFSSDTTKINPPANDNLFKFSVIETKYVEDHIKNLKNGKAAGLDGIGIRMLKTDSPVLSICLAQIFNQSLKIGYIPKCWKIKRVLPIHKGDEKTV